MRTSSRKYCKLQRETSRPPAFDPQRPNRVYAGVGRPRWNKGGAGAIYCSDDIGLTWRLISSGQLPADAIVPDPMTREQLWLCYADIGLLVSNDAGQSFRRSFDGMKNSGNCFTVAVDPQQPATVWPGLFVTRSVSEEFSVFFLADASGYDARRFGQDSRNSFVDVHVGRTLVGS